VSHLSNALQAQHDWLTAGAVDKVDSIEALTAGIPISSVVEIGAGTGAILSELDKRAFAARYVAIEPASQMAAFLKEHTTATRLECVIDSTLADADLTGQRFDLAILSHVLEHVAAPSVLLAEALAVARYVVAEVPLEGNWNGNLRSMLKERLTKRPRIDHLAGHVHFWSRSEFKAVVDAAGGTIRRERLYAPAMKPAPSDSAALLPRMRRTATRQARALAGSWVWSRLYHGHYAVLIERAVFTKGERVQELYRHAGE
jgi:ubiquinone/menaquinone biosynthesis C-methylase UbiE